MSSIKKLLKNPCKIIHILNRIGVSKIIPDALYLKIAYRAYHGESLNLEKPVSFNEKLQWLKLHDRNPAYTSMVDKYEVKKYISEIIGEEYVIPTLGVWEKFEDIDFDSLPEQFVLKCTHDSGGLVICKNKSDFDIETAKKKINKSLRKNFYYTAREWPYKNVKPRIIAEKYMEDIEAGELIDYKFYCFSGEPKLMFIGTERYIGDGPVKFDFFDMNFGHIDLTIEGHANAKVLPKKPQNFEKMKQFCMILSKDIPHVRVDFYEVNGKLFFGELTFFDSGGYQTFNPKDWDFILGSYINIPEK